MMSQVIRQETLVFFLSVLHGACLAFGYDLLRALRRGIPHGRAAVSAEDFLFWILAGFLTFCLLFFRTNGVLRGYVAAGILMGAVLYHFTLSFLIVAVFSWIFRQFRRLFCLIYHVFHIIHIKICRITKKMIEFVGKRVYNSQENRSKG